MLTALVFVLLAQADAVPYSQLRTARPLEFYVSPVGVDGRTCRTRARACRTPANVLASKIPFGVYHQVVINVLAMPDGGVAEYDAGVGYLQNHFFGAADPDNPGQVVIRCEQRPARLDGGTAGGTFSAVTNGSGASWASYTDGAQVWVSSAMVDGGSVSGVAAGPGYWLALTGGPGADGGMRLPVIDNTATVLTVPGQFPVAPSTSTTYEVQEPAVVFSGTAGVVQLPGSITGTSLRANFPTQLVVRNNVSGYAPSITSGSPDGGSWSPVIVQGCHFRGDSALQMAALAVDGPVAVLESRFEGFGANGRVTIPISSRAELVFSRNSVDVPGGRAVSFTRLGTDWSGLTFEQNVVVAAEYAVFGGTFRNGFLSHNNLFQRISTAAGPGAVYRLLETADGYAFGDRVQHAPVYLRYPGGSLEQQGGRGQFWIEGVNAGDINGPNGFVALSGRGGLFVGVGNGNGPYGAAASVINIASGSRLVTAQGPATGFYWKHSNTTITEDGASATLSSSVNLNDYIASFSVAFVDSTTPHEVCSFRGTCVGWLDDAQLPYESVIAYTGSGSGGAPQTMESFSGTTSVGGTLTVNFSPAFRVKPKCFATYEGDPGGGAVVPWSATTDGGVVWTATASKPLVGWCVGDR